nr:MAG TPA: hypothetical protein [Caudoviricetes sp.]
MQNIFKMHTLIHEQLIFLFILTRYKFFICSYSCTNNLLFSKY